MVECSTVGVTLSSLQLKKLKTAAKNQTGVTLRINIKMFNGSNLSHELLLTGRPKTKWRNALESNMSTAINLSRAQISKIIQSRWFLGSLLSKLAVPLMKVAAPLAKNILTSIRNNSCCFSNWCRSSEENSWFRKYNLNCIKWWTKWYHENCSSS